MTTAQDGTPRPGDNGDAGRGDEGRAGGAGDASAAPRRMLDKAPVSPGTVPPDEAPRHNDDVQLPHERDQSVGGDSTGGHGTGAAGENQREVIGQAREDLAQGQVDTDLRGTPGLDAERRDRLDAERRDRLVKDAGPQTPPSAPRRK
ncbi:hypothetical protein [Mitsuaria sp. GD03876]|uniref:hypothetical protein n=1 Tax=Mitsuaria sp. GD03876 TaxID=2975399 RepID=UPI00244A688F|nr:hypothetical protein [Mitsuaria sp. GD03876]MDH0866089.1 hypothetical protein [Mitsuaria sp. GD03876]